MSLKRILRQVRACRSCEADLPFGPRPIVQLAPTARLLIISQAPGSKVHQSGIPWNDASGDRLREWLKLDCPTFYDEAKVAILPMGFCYPGAGETEPTIRLGRNVHRFGMASSARASPRPSTDAVDRSVCPSTLFGGGAEGFHDNEIPSGRFRDMAYIFPIAASKLAQRGLEWKTSVVRSG